MNIEISSRIAINQNQFGGRPTVRNSGVLVEVLLGMLAYGASIREILEEYPELDEEDISACISYAHEIVSGIN